MDEASAPSLALVGALRGDVTLTHLTLRWRTSFDDFSNFCDALRQNTTVKSIRIHTAFLVKMTEANRVLLMETVGSLSGLEELAIGTVLAGVLTTALRCSVAAGSHLRTLMIRKLRISCRQDVLDLANAMRGCRSLEEVSFPAVKLDVTGSNRVNAEGKIWFQTDGSSLDTCSLDPLLRALASLPVLKHLQFHHFFNGSRIQPPSESALRALCQPPRKSLVFDSCGLSEHQCAVIADELKSPASTLEKLEVSKNYQTSSGTWDAFVDMLAVNYSIVDFPHGQGESNTLAPKQQAKLGYYVKLNQAGRGRFLRGSVSTRRDAWLHFLIQGRHDLDIVFFALQADPSLYAMPN